LEIKPSEVDVVLLEYDRRFEVYGDCFCYYDYHDPLNLPEKVAQHSFGLVVADPPFLSEECLRKTAQTVKYLASNKIILCTGTSKTNSLEILKKIPQGTRRAIILLCIRMSENPASSVYL
jgi:16S rRNA G966 N2-methylase RsmD